jgi:hypothetical protein
LLDIFSLRLSLVPLSSLCELSNNPGLNPASSVELVEVINQERDPWQAELRHDNFMLKIENHPGIDALNSKGVYLGGNGQKRPITSPVISC